MDQETANALFDNGAIVLFLDAPSNMEFGVDCYSWTTGPIFKGLKLIPPGMHFIYYSAVNRMGESTAIRTGFWVNFLPRQVLVKRWNPATEDVFADDELDEEETNRFRTNFRDFDRFLGVYPLLPIDGDPISPYQKWLRLSTHITPDIAKRVLPQSGKISAMSCVSRFSDVDETRPEFRSRGVIRAEQKEATVDSMDIVPSQSSTSVPNTANKTTALPVEVLQLTFTPIDLKRSFPPGASGVELTKYSIDKSYLLAQALKLHYKDYKDLLGELQLSFIIFLIGEVYDGYEQWKTLVHLLCQSAEAIGQYGCTLFPEFIEILIKQLKVHPSDFFMDALSGDNFIRSNILLLSQTLRDRDSPVPKLLQDAMQTLLDFVDMRFKWDVRQEARLTQMDEEDDEGEYAPVVVEL
ncbi:hypothetical protein PhCBS80983_g01460 [Powellomyces hirtus]|uniref:AAR2 splicing factor homolog n=1 Tax=Powellomyces hirtus TaxID=109895 RepID=A0A507EC45_9FUNG|nr:hypothetical protein PhCBS80983_g01460 [Powellomyces hirtus]